MRSYLSLVLISGKVRRRQNRMTIFCIIISVFLVTAIFGVADILVKGDLSEIYGDSDKVMTVLNEDNPIKVGDTIQIEGQEIEVACGISSGLYPGEYNFCQADRGTELQYDWNTIKQQGYG